MLSEVTGVQPQKAGDLNLYSTYTQGKCVPHVQQYFEIKYKQTPVLSPGLVPGAVIQCRSPRPAPWIPPGELSFRERLVHQRVCRCSSVHCSGCSFHTSQQQPVHRQFRSRRAFENNAAVRQETFTEFRWLSPCER